MEYKQVNQQSLSRLMAIKLTLQKDFSPEQLSELSAKISLQAEFIHRPQAFEASYYGGPAREKPNPVRWSMEDAFCFYNYILLCDHQGTWFDEENAAIVELLLLYFTNDQGFYELAGKIGILQPHLQKGILLCGKVGRGKTFLLTLFSQNQRQPYKVFNAKTVANAFEKEGLEAIEQFDKKIKFPYTPIGNNFYHSHGGLCIDDAGTEDLKIYMGNRRNVIGDIIENRYANGCMGKLFHATTNLTFKQLKEYYGERASSRLMQCMNVIQLNGIDRRASTGWNSYIPGNANERPKPVNLGTSEARIAALNEWGIGDKQGESETNFVP